MKLVLRKWGESEGMMLGLGDIFRFFADEPYSWVVTHFTGVGPAESYIDILQLENDMNESEGIEYSCTEILMFFGKFEDLQEIRMIGGNGSDDSRIVEIILFDSWLWEIKTSAASSILDDMRKDGKLSNFLYSEPTVENHSRAQ